MSEQSTWRFFLAQHPYEPIEILVSPFAARLLEDGDKRLWASLIDYVEDVISQR